MALAKKKLTVNCDHTYLGCDSRSSPRPRNPKYFDCGICRGNDYRGIPDDTEHRVFSRSVVFAKVDNTVVTIIMEWY